MNGRPLTREASPLIVSTLFHKNMKFYLSDLAIRNPVFAVVLAGAMLIFGYLSYIDLGVSQFPELDFPVVSVTTNREASAPEIMDNDVTDIIEDAISNVEGIDYMQSQSSQGVSVVTTYFRLSRDVDAAMQDVQNAVAAAANRLPNDIDPPNVSKVNFNKFPIIWLSIHGPVTLRELNNFVEDHLKKEVQTIPGVGGVIYGGLRQRTMRIWLDREKLREHNLDALDVWRAIQTQHVELPAGYLAGEVNEMNVRFKGEAVTPEEFGNIAIYTNGLQVVRLKEVAIVEDGLADKRTFARFNGRPNVGLGVMRATGANVVEVCDAVKAKLPELRKKAPPGVEIAISTDFSLFIKDDIEEVKEALLLGIILTALVTFLFLGSLGTTLNVCISIPSSLVGTFVAIKMLGFTINFMTLLGLSLSVGVVVDDAILVLENIYRRRENGESRWQAALEGAREISFAALAATLSIVAIFIPIALMDGAIGRFFYQFGITVSISVCLSLIIALTVTPMLCSIFLDVHHLGSPPPRRYRGPLGLPVTFFKYSLWILQRFLLEPLLIRPVNWGMRISERVYRVVLGWSLRHPVPVLIFGLLIAASAFLFTMGVNVAVPSWLRWSGLGERIVVKPLGRELVPSEDQNRFVVSMICPVGTNIDYVSETLARGEQMIAELRDPVHENEVVAAMFATISIRPGSLITEGTIFIRLIPAEERSWTQTDVMNEVRKRLSSIAGVRVVVLDLSTQGFTPARGYPVDFAIQGPDWETTIQLSERIRERLQRPDEILPAGIDPETGLPTGEKVILGGQGFLTDIVSDYRPGMPEVQIRPDRSRLNERGVDPQRVAFDLGIGTGGFRDGRFTAGSRRYDVRVRNIEQERDSPDDLADDYIKANNGKLVPARDIVKSEVVSTLPVINRYNHMRKVEITANVAPGATQGDAIRRALAVAEQQRAEMGLGENYRFVVLGNSMAMQQTLDSLTVCLVLGFVVAYMILGIQFNSYIHPLTVLMAVPFGVTGALLTLWLLGHTLNMMSMIGMILLAGLVKKNSIILVDYTNQLRQSGMGLYEAVLKAGPTRLRPIVMTSIATVAGAIPLAIGAGSGAETRAPLAQSIIGGSILATLVTLVVVPVMYVTFDRLSRFMLNLNDKPAQPTEG